MSEATTLKLRPVIGCRIEIVEGLAFLAYPVDRTTDEAPAPEGPAAPPPSPQPLQP